MNRAIYEKYYTYFNCIYIAIYKICCKFTKNLSVKEDIIQVDK